MPVDSGEISEPESNLAEAVAETKRQCTMKQLRHMKQLIERETEKQRNSEKVR